VGWAVVACFKLTTVPVDAAVLVRLHTLLPAHGLILQNRDYFFGLVVLQSRKAYISPLFTLAAWRSDFWLVVGRVLQV